jgi:hypothetical protein
MENSQISATYFDVVFNPDDNSLRYNFNFNSEINDYIYADADVYAYGFKIISKRIDLCSLGWTQFCPLYPGQVEIDSIQYLADEYADQIPGIAYSVPDIDAFARVILSDSNGTQVGCIQAFFTNGKTVSQTGIKWATAVIAGLGLLASAIASAFGNSNASSHISANAVSLFLYFQSVVVVAMQHVDSVPPIAAAWAENLAWSMGLIRVSFMQKIFRWYIQATGGSPELQLTSQTINILVQRTLDYTVGLIENAAGLLEKRVQPVVLYGNSNVLILRGIKRMAYRANIEITSFVITGFTFFVFFAYVLVGVIFIVKYASELFVRVGWLKPERFLDLRQNWRTILKGSISRYIFIGFTQLIILSLFEFYQRDSPAVIVLAALFLILSLTVLGWTAYRVVTFGKKSIELHKNPAAILYGDQKILDKYGFFYTMFNANKYWWGIVVLGHSFIKCVFIALAQGSGKTQAVVFWIIDMVYLGLLIHYKPYLNTPTNVLNILIQLVTTINSFIFTFFANLYHQPAAGASILAWVFFILNAAFSLILLILILVFCAYILFSKNPDAKFKPAKDDRRSFQRFSHHAGQQSPAAELLALGLTAKDHNENWQKEIYNLKDVHNKSSDISNSTNELPIDEDTRIELEDDEKETFAGKVVRKLTGKKSIKRNKSAKRSKSQSGQQSGVRLLSNSSYLDPKNNGGDPVDDDDYNDEFSYAKDEIFQETAGTHNRNESIASFSNALGNDATNKNDFIDDDVPQRRSFGLRDLEEDDYHYSKI